MSKDFESDRPMQDGSSERPIADFLARAKAASDSGDELLGMYLYLAAFEESSAHGSSPSEAAITGLKSAWVLACTNKERQLAEYIFDKLEPYLNSTEIEICANTLHDLALDKLEEFGLSRDDLEEMAQMISEDLFDGQASFRIDNVSIHGLPKVFGGSAASAGKGGASIKGLLKTASSKTSDDADRSSASVEASEGSKRATSMAPGEIAEGLMHPEEMLTYKNLAGYDRAIAKMRELGIGMGGNESFDQLVKLLNRMHGLDSMPALDAVLFRSVAREDANRFMMATLGEMQKPTLHMRMEDGIQGMPVLCVSTHGIDLSRLSSARDVFHNGGVLVLEDLDMWFAPDMEMGDENGFFMMQLTRGAREAVELIQNAIEHPDVCVFATASQNASIDGFFMDLLGPVNEIVIDLPTPEERAEIWLQIAKEHPSIRGINRVDLVRLTANMPRFDIYMAVREAIESAYKQGLRARRYTPVTRDNLFDKLAAYQPLDSGEYGELQENVINDFKRELDDIDDLLKSE